MTAIARAEQHDHLQAATTDVALILEAGVRPIGPAELTRVRARRRFLRLVARESGGYGHHDLPAA